MNAKPMEPHVGRLEGIQGKVPARSVLVSDWRILLGAQVIVLQDSQRLREGRVEEVTGDGNTAWIAGSVGFGRQVIDKGSGFKLLLGPDQIQDIGRKQP